MPENNICSNTYTEVANCNTNGITGPILLKADELKAGQAVRYCPFVKAKVTLEVKQVENGCILVCQCPANTRESSQ